MNSINDVTVQRITGNIGAVIGGVDMRTALPTESIAAVRQALLDHGVIFFRGQDITLDQYWAFMESFGQPQKEESAGTDHDRADEVQTGDMSSIRHSTAVWHADTTSLARPPIATAIRAVQVPEFGGDTCWSSMYAAWDALTGPIQRMLDGLTAIHSVVPTYLRMGEYRPMYEANYGSRHAPEQVHPVVITHPESGRKALYVNESFTTRLVELERLESDAVLAFLFRHVERPDFIMRWKWTANDVAFWDNRSVQHYAVPDYRSTRLMQRIVLAGVKPGDDSSLTPRDRTPASSPA